MSDPARVAIVFDDNPELVERLVREMPVWVARTERINAVAPRLREEGVELTTFDFDPDADIEEQLLYVIPEAELHHGASGGRLPLARLDVYGAKLTERTTILLDQLGLSSVEPVAGGFNATP
jgi:hypothetical protein